MTLVKMPLSRKFGEKAALLSSTAVFAWVGVVMASAACACELAISGTVPLHITLSAMVGVHSLIGIGEALITVVVLVVVLQTRPDLVDAYKGPALLPATVAEEV
jgi:cobalt/nickel transport system permease protein